MREYLIPQRERVTPMNTTEQLNTVINQQSSIFAIGMTYGRSDTPFNVRLFFMDDEKYACGKYHQVEDVPAIALLTSMNAGVKASINGFTKNLFFADIGGDSIFSGLPNCVVCGSEYRRVKDTPYALVTVYNLDTKKRVGVSVENVTLAVCRKFNVIPL